MPNSQELTKYILNIDKLKNIKGSDASWSNDNEPPVECLDYSDDEEERANKQRLKSLKTANVDETQPKKAKPNNQTFNNTQRQFRPRNANNFNSFRQPFHMPQLINQSFQQMISPQMNYNHFPHFFNQHPPQFYRQPFINNPINYNLTDQRKIVKSKNLFKITSNLFIL